MTEGMPIVPVVQISGKYSAQFDSERLIHGKIREYTLRSAAHWNQVNKVVAHSAAVSQASSNDHQANKVISADDFILVAQSLSASALRAIEFPAIQKGLREFVLAHLIRDAVDDSRVSVHAISSSSSRGITGNNHSDHIVVSQLVGASKNGLYQLSSKISSSATHVLLIHGLMAAHSRSLSSHWEQISRQVNHKNGEAANWGTNHGADGFSSRDKLSALVCLLISCKALNSSKDSFSGSNRKCFKFLESYSKIVSSTSIPGRLGTSPHLFALKDSCGFGTAPIWYQQSMATGPPFQVISLHKKTSATALGGQ
jgi:hypothetical protein